MCGIIGILGRGPVAEQLVDSLKRLEYRGYDSAGVATLEGDTLAYHLPNAAAWVRAGSIWTTTTRYWWYPGGSELFAAGLLAVAGPFSVLVAGAGPVALLGMRLATWCRALGTGPWTAAAIGAASIAAPVIALSSGPKPAQREKRLAAC